MKPSLRSVAILAILTSSGLLLAGVRREIQDEYIRRYVNRTVFLKVPLTGARHILVVRPGGFTPAPGNEATGLTFRVGEQVRVTDLRFSSQEIRFQVSSIDLARQNEIVFRFPTQLSDDFPERPIFDTALDKAFTEGMSNTEIAEARRDFLKREFQRIVREMSETTGTDSGFVIAAISDEIPGVSETKRMARDLDSELQAAKGSLVEESDRRRKAEAALAQLRQDSRSNESVIDSLKQERETLVGEKSALQREVNRLNTEAGESRKRVDELARTLDVRNSSAADLTRSLERLNQTVEGLKRDRDRAQADLKGVQQELSQEKETRRKTANELETAQGENNRLRRNLRDLTSDKNSLSSRYIETKNAKEGLESLGALQRALRLETRREARSGQEYLVGDLYLSKHRIASLQSQVPLVPGRSYRVEFSIDSPDTVEFGEEERRLYALLGEKWTVETGWRVSGQGLSVELRDGDPSRTLSARESAAWDWSFQGELAQAQDVMLTAGLVVGPDRRVSIAEFPFQLHPSGFGGSIRRTFSGLWLGLGALLGMVAMIPVLLLRSRPSRGTRPPSRTKRSVVEVAEQPYVARKKL